MQSSPADGGVNISVSLVEYARLDLPARGLPDLVRASVHYYNDDDDLGRLLEALPGRPTGALRPRREAPAPAPDARPAACTPGVEC